MAKSASVVSDSDGKARGASEPTNDKPTDGEPENEEEEDEEEEYEIEQILDHQYGMFDGRTGFFCKWKGYGTEHNSWVDEEDAGNATELIDVYWKKATTKKAGRKSGDLSTKRGRASAAADSPEPVSAAKKRGRKSAAAKEEEEEEQVSKRPKKTSSRRKNESTEPEDIVMDEPEEQIADIKHMKKFMSSKSWEEIVDQIDTVERPSEKGPLMVYFRLNAKNGGTRVRLDSTVCREKFPQALLTFYESNLKWKETEVEDDAL